MLLKGNKLYTLLKCNPRINIFKHNAIKYCLFIILSISVYIFYESILTYNTSYQNKIKQNYYIIDNNLNKLYITDCYSCGIFINLCESDNSFNDAILSENDFKDLNDKDLKPTEYHIFNCSDVDLVPAKFYDALKNYRFKSYTFITDYVTNKLYFAAGSIFVEVDSCYMCGRDFGDMCNMKPNIAMPTFLINKFLNGMFECAKHIPEIFKPNSLERGTNMFSISNNKKHFIYDCFSCGVFLDLCDNKNNKKYRIEIYDHGFEYITVGEPFACCEHATDNIYKALQDYSFPMSTYITVPGTFDLFFANKNIFVRIITCFDCGSSFGSFCGRMPTFSIPKCVSQRLDTGGIFECHKHVPEYLKYTKSYKTFTIVTPLHTLTIANLMASALRQFNLEVAVTHEMPLKFIDDMYFILAANVFITLPPPEKRILYQLEQSVSRRWFTPKYIADLRDSYAVFDYHSENIIILEDSYKVHHNVWYLPVGISKDLYSISTSNPVAKEWDLIFYGDVHGRRGLMLDVLRKKFKIHVVTEVFGEEMLSLIRKARFVVNMHYYENGLLELPRIFESLSLGVPVISEDSPDRLLVADLEEPLVFFWDYNNIDSMVHVISRVLDLPIVDKDLFNKRATKSHNYFMYMFYRGLMGLGIISDTDISKLLPFIPRIEKKNLLPLILSLPEAAKRRKLFLTDPHPGASMGISIFSIRHIFRATWISCALSYSLLAKVALRDELPRLAIAEDDAIFGPHFDVTYKIIHDYLDTLDNEWHIFSGLVSDLHINATILKAEYFQGILFITIDKMTGMVFNIYNTNMYIPIANWDALNENAVENTIDRNIERIPNLRVVTTFPYMVGHRQATKSTIWNFDNSEYNKIFEKSRLLMADKLSRFNSRKF